VLQNALRAVVEFHGKSTDLPKIKILICEGHEDIIIKVIVVTVSLCTGIGFTGIFLN